MAGLIASSELIAVIGLGETGLSIARFLKEKNLNFIMLDTRTTPPNAEQFAKDFPGVACEFGPLKEDTLSQVSKIVIRPGVDRKLAAGQQAISNKVPVVGDIQLFIEQKAEEQKIVAITGSNGKTTVTTLVGEMMEQAGKQLKVGGNIGTPVLDMLSEGRKIDGYVLELSSFQLESTTQLNADVAVVLNVSADHMDRYDSFPEYHFAKQRIFFGAKTAVVNRQDPLSKPPMRSDLKVISFGLDKPDLGQFGVIEEEGEKHIALGLEKLMNAGELNIRGSHNLSNALAALAIGYGSNLPMQSMLKTLKNFSGLPHRCQYLGKKEGVEFFNDSKGTNVGATLAAIQGLAESGKKIVLIAGGDGKEADFSMLQNAFSQHLRALVNIGKDGPLLASVAKEAGVFTEQANSLEHSVERAFHHAQNGDLVLLSPACASFDMFKSYVDRGDQFCDLVKRLMSDV